MSDHKDLKTKNIKAITQDASGYIWLGTHNGLYRFDGYNYVHYKHDKHDKQNANSLAENFVHTLWADKNDDLWIGTETYLTRLDTNTGIFSNFLNPSGSAIKKIMPATGGGIYLITRKSLSHFSIENRKFTYHDKFRTNTSLDPVKQVIYAAHYNNEKELLVGTTTGIYALDSDSFELVALHKDLLKAALGEDLAITAIYVDSSGKIWLDTNVRGLAIIEQGQEAKLSFPLEFVPGLSNYQITSMLQVNEDEVWCAIEGEGIYVVDRVTGEFLRKSTADTTVSSSLNSNKTQQIFKSNSGLIWLAQSSDNGGLNVFDGINNTVKTLYSHSLSNNSFNLEKTNAILETETGHFWLGGEGLNYLDLSTGRIVALGENSQKIDKLSRTRSPIKSISAGQGETIWLLLQGRGIVNYNPATDASLSIPQKNLGLSEISLMTSNQDEIIWIYDIVGPKISAYNFRSNIHKTYQLDADQTLERSEGKKLVVDDQDTLWIATEDGLYFLLESSSSNTNKKVQPSTFSAGNIHNLTSDKFGNLWLATSKGLFRQDNSGKITDFSNIIGKSRQSDETRFGRTLQSDDKSWIWGSGGVLDTKTEKYSAYENSANINLSNNWFDSSYLTSNERLILGSAEGLIIIDTSEFESWKFEPPVTFSNIQVNGESTTLPKTNATITMRSDRSHLEVQMSALDYSAPSRNLYSYKLEGFDEHWIDTTSDHRRIRYTSLPPGSYQLKARGSNRNGIFSDQEPEISIIVNPTFTQTLRFKIILFVVCSLTTLLIFFMRIKQLERNRVLLAQQVRDGTRELRKRHSKLELNAAELDQHTSELENKELALGQNKLNLENKSLEISTTMNELMLAQERLVAQEKLSSLGELVSGLAHEINTPLGVGVTAASHLQDRTKFIQRDYKSGSLTQEKLEAYMKTAVQSSDILMSNLSRSSELIQSFKKVSVNQSHDELTEFHIIECLNQIATSLTPVVKQNNHRIIVTGDASIKMTSYPGFISQLLNNLIMNSVLHGFAEKTSGNIQLDACLADNDKLQIRYQDDGCGITQESLKKIFDPFYTTNRGSGSTGLGLSIVFNLITKNLAGSIKCSSEVDQYTIFDILLPLHLAPIESDGLSIDADESI